MATMKKLHQIALASVIAFASLPVLAQDGAIGTLTNVNGTVMTSNGGEFVSASANTPVAAGDQLMIGQDSSASITYTNGAVTNFTAPGTYTVNLPVAGAAGSAGVGATGGASAAATAGIIVGTAALAAVATEQAVMEEKVPPDQPISR